MRVTIMRSLIAWTTMGFADSRIFSSALTRSPFSLSPTSQSLAPVPLSIEFSGSSRYAAITIAAHDNEGPERLLLL